ncbi:unnamed protein product [Diamesa tonsa]
MSVSFNQVNEDRVRTLPQNIKDNIFNKFDVNQLLTATLVCQEWNTMVSNSKPFKKKVWLRRYSPESDLDSIRNSKRSYENFKLSDSAGGRSIECVLEQYPKRAVWKRVYLSFRNVYSPFLTDVVEMVANSIEELEIRSIQCLNLSEEIIFPKLKRLRFVNTHEFAFEAFLFRTPALTTLSVQSPIQDKVNIIPLLREKPHVLHLQLKGIILLEMFDINLNGVLKLNLKSLNLNNDTGNELTENIERNMIQFVQNQHSLERLFLDRNLSNKLITLMWNRMPISVHHISFKELTQQTIQVCFLNVNENITDLDFEGSGRTLEELQPFLEASPNLKRLYVKELTLELIEYCGKNLGNLESLKYQTTKKLFLGRYEKCKAILSKPCIRNKKFRLDQIDFTEHIIATTEFGWFKTPVYHHFLRFY